MLPPDDKTVPVAQVEGSPYEVRLVAIAPDGTHLWVAGGSVYFASSGAQWSHPCGKGCTRTEIVPTTP